MESTFKPNDLIAALTRSPHGELKGYVPYAVQAQRNDQMLYAHLIAWNHRNGQVRDAKVALPVLGLLPSADMTFEGNALAHMALLNPREFARAVAFAKELPARSVRAVRRLAGAYLRWRESGRFDRIALTHHKVLKGLYAGLHIKPGKRAQEILFERKYPEGSLQADLKSLATCSPKEAAALIVGRKIPFLAARGALGARAKDPDLLFALVETMTPAELITNMKALERLGVKDTPALRGAFEAALLRASSKARSGQTLLKAQKAIDVVEDEDVKVRLKEVQEKRIERTIDGNWVVIGDRSGSMEAAIGVAKQVAGVLARSVKGQVLLVFSNVSAIGYDVTGKSMEDIEKLTRGVTAYGGTSLGAGLEWAMSQMTDLDGVAVVSDGAENSYPSFGDVYDRLLRPAAGRDVPVYYYRTKGEPGTMLRQGCEERGVVLEEFDLRGGVDYYSLPNLVATMRANRFSLVDEVMATPLLTLEDVMGVAA